MIVPLHDLNRYITVSGGGKDGRARFEHVVIAEKALGRKLPNGVKVHHLNGVKSDNRNQNLVICENESYHQLIHRRQRVHEAGGDPNTQTACKKCGLLRPMDEIRCQDCDEIRDKKDREQLETFALRLERPQREWMERYLDLAPISSMDKYEINSIMDGLREDDFQKVEEWLMSDKLQWNCRYPDCRKGNTAGRGEGGSRGLCMYHYGIAMRLVRSGKVTWETLESRGKSLPARPGGTPDLEAQAYFLNNEAEPAGESDTDVETETLQS